MISDITRFCSAGLGRKRRSVLKAFEPRRVTSVDPRVSSLGAGIPSLDWFISSDVKGGRYHQDISPPLTLTLMSADPTVAAGIPSLDWFISSDVEVAEADGHYSERLWRMKGLGAYLHRPAMATEKRATLRQRLQAQLTLPDQVLSIAANGEQMTWFCIQKLYKGSGA
jgi:hypothetical protein